MIKESLSNGPSLMDAITFVNLDWDFYGDDPYTQELNIPRRSTLVLLKGDKEISRIVAGTARRDEYFDI